MGVLAEPLGLAEPDAVDALAGLAELEPPDALAGTGGLAELLPDDAELEAGLEELAAEALDAGDAAGPPFFLAATNFCRFPNAILRPRLLSRFTSAAWGSHHFGAEPGFRGIGSGVKFKPWKVNVPEVLRKAAPPRQSQREQAAAILRSWHLSVPSETDVERVFHLLEAPADGTLTKEHRARMGEAFIAASTYREQLLDAIRAFATPLPA